MPAVCFYGWYLHTYPRNLINFIYNDDEESDGDDVANKEFDIDDLQDALDKHDTGLKCHYFYNDCPAAISIWMMKEEDDKKNKGKEIPILSKEDITAHETFMQSIGIYGPPRLYTITELGAEEEE